MTTHRNIQRALGVAILVGATTGCGITYQIAGQFEDTGEPFYGDVWVTLDTGTINVATEDGRVTCEGTSWITERPSLMTTTGGAGSAEATCSDGRTFKIDFVQTSEAGGHGHGVDNNGNVVQVFFGTSKALARSQLDRQRLNQMLK